MIMNKAMKQTKLLAAAIIICMSACVTERLQANDFLADAEQKTQGVYGFVGAGVGFVNEFQGSEDYQAIPFLGGRIHQEKRYVELLGLGARANILNHSNWQFGPALRFRFGRDDDVDNARISQLNEVDDAIEAGFFTRYDMPTGYHSGDSLGFELQFLHDISDAHEGYVISTGLDYNAPITQKIRAGMDLGTSYTSGDTMESFYSVSNAESLRSGISPYSADSGFTDVTVGFNAQYALQERWGLFTRVSYQRLLGDAADSSIVESEGSPNQFLFGAGVSYRF